MRLASVRVIFPVVWAVALLSSDARADLGVGDLPQASTNPELHALAPRATTRRTNRRKSNQNLARFFGEIYLARKMIERFRSSVNSAGENASQALETPPAITYKGRFRASIRLESTTPNAQPTV